MTVPIGEPEPGTPGAEGAPGDPAGHGGDGGDGGKGGRGGVGIRGKTGKTGVTGVRGDIGGWSDKAMAFLVVVLTLVFGFLYVRTAVSQGEIERDRYQSCVAGHALILQYNEQQAALAAIERVNPNEAIADRRVRIYEAGMLAVPDCGQPPGG